MDTITELTRKEHKTISDAWRALRRISNVFQPQDVYHALLTADPNCDPADMGNKMLAIRAIEPTGEDEDMVTIDRGEWEFLATK
jgi:hypothetical protein